MRTPRVLQFHSGSAVGDAVTNSLFYIQDLLAEAGIPSRIFVEHLDPRLADRLKLIGSLTDVGPQDLLLLHHSMGHEVMPLLRALPCRKVLVYHSITPPHFFSDHPQLRAAALQGYGQLHELRDMVSEALADSDYNTEQLCARGFERVQTLPLLRDFKAIRQQPYARHLHYVGEPRHLLMFAGRVAPNKGQLELVRFMQRYADSFRLPLELALPGNSQNSGGYADLVHREVIASGLASRIHLVGHVSDAELNGWYRAADAYVSLSEHEGFGVPLVEAMAFDVPVLAFDAGAIRATLGGGGVLLPDRTPETLARALGPVLESAALRRELILGQRDRLRAFDREHVGAQLLEVVRPYLRGRAFRRARPAGEPSARQYLVEGPCESSYSLAIVNRNLALALEHRRPGGVQLVASEGVAHYEFNAEAAKAYPEITPLLEPLPSDGTTIVNIRNQYPPRPSGMRGDLRLMNFFWEETEVPARLVRQMEHYLDGVLVASAFGRKALRDSGLSLPIAVVGCGIDHLRGADEKAEPVTGDQRTFTFLHVSSGLARKGIEELLTAYCAAFSASDPVRLVIKTYANVTNVVEQWRAKIADFVGAPAIEVIYDSLDEDEMADLYRGADAVVLPTRGEGFNLPAAEAMAFGAPVVVTDFSAHRDFCTDANSWLIAYRLAPSESHLRSASALWARPDVGQLAGTLRRLFQRRPEDEELFRSRQSAARDTAADLRWDAVATRTEDFVTFLENPRPEKNRLSLAWVSTWNKRCGIATYSESLVAELPKELFDITIFADKTLPTREDVDDVRRVWIDRGHPLDELRAGLLEGDFDVAVFQFNFGFFELTAFGILIRDLEAAGIDVYVFFHATADAPVLEGIISLGSIRDDLAQAKRLVVHGVADVNRLAGIGLTDNVVMLPQGVSVGTALSPVLIRRFLGFSDDKVVASYGFMLPNKGLTELLLAFSLLTRSLPALRLLMVNGEYPNPVSIKERDACLELIEQLGLSGRVTLVSDYLDHEESLILLQSADVIVFPYQKTGESSSAAVRSGLAARRPVATTPLEIFDDVKDVTYRLPGTSAADMAKGLRRLLTDADLRQDLVARQNEWLGQTAWPRIAERLTGLIVGLHQDTHGVRIVRAPEPVEFASKSGVPNNGLLELAPEPFIRLAYQRFRGGHYDGDTARFLSGLEAGEISRGEILRALDTGAPVAPAIDLTEEELLSGDDTVFVHRLYATLLHREPDSTGADFHVGRLRDGSVSRESLLDVFLNSDEFLNANRPIRVVPDAKPAWVAG